MLKRSFLGILIILLFSSMFINSRALASSIEVGDSGDEVREIQIKLKQYGYKIDKIDGEFGSQTRMAVLNFQKDIGLDAPGKVDKITYRVLFKKNMPEQAAGSGNFAEMIRIALRYRGVPYAFGGTSPYGFDCSGFTQYVFRQIGVDLPRMADAQYYSGRAVSKSNLMPGDLVFFETYEAGPSHVGIYMGNGQFVAANSSTGVAVASIYDPYYWGPRYLGARRY